MSLTADFTPHVSLRATILAWLVPAPCVASSADDAIADEARMRRSFVSEAMDRTPEAMTGEYGVQSMMAFYPREF